jgi:hypothetical protein
VEAQHLQMDPASIGVLVSSPAHPERAVLAQWNCTPAMTAQHVQVLRCGDNAECQLS